MTEKCTNCGRASATDYCADCEQFRERLEALRLAQKRFRAAVGKRRPGAKQQIGAAFKEQCQRYGEMLQAAGELPLSGQDAALPVGDR